MKKRGQKENNGVSISVKTNGEIKASLTYIKANESQVHNHTIEKGKLEK